MKCLLTEKKNVLFKNLKLLWTFPRVTEIFLEKKKYNAWMNVTIQFISINNKTFSIYSILTYQCPLGH